MREDWSPTRRRPDQPRSRASNLGVRAAFVVVAWSCVVSVPHGLAQTSSYTADPRQSATYRAIDQGLADQTPLSAASRVVPLDLRQPVGFDRLFRLTGPGDRLETRTGDGRSAGGNGLFFRFSGGLIASFPRSVYADTPGGLRPLIPPGTTFSIGQKAAWGPGSLPPLPFSRARAQPTQRLSAQASANGMSRPARDSTSNASPTPSTTPNARGATTPREPAREIESLWSGEAYRRRVIERLLSIRSSP